MDRTEEEIAEAELLGETEDAAEERLHPILSNDEVLKARAAARTKIDAERRKTAMKAVEEQEAERLRQEGFVTGDSVQDEIVAVTLDLAPHSDRVIIDGKIYMHGMTYNVPRSKAAVLAETQCRGWEHQDIIDGKDKLQHYQRPHLTTISERTGVVQNAPQRAA